MHPRGTVDHALSLLAAGRTCRDVARELGLPEGTVGHWRRGSRRAADPQPRCFRCRGEPAPPCYPYMLGMYLGDGHIVVGRRGVQSLSVVGDDGWPGILDEVEAAIDVLVHYAGWTDKIAAVLGGVNPVAAPFLSFSLPEPTGVVGVVAPDEPELLGLVAEIAPALAAGNTCVVVAAAERPLPAVALSEVLATSDVPPGAVNLLTGHAAEPARWLATHADVNALDPTGAPPQLRAELEAAAAGTFKRVLPVRSAHGAEPDWTAPPGIDRLRACTELKTVWHPIGT